MRGGYIDMRKLYYFIAIILIFAVGYGFGYSVGREDLSLVEKRKATVRETLELLSLANEDQKWIEWEETIEKSEKLTEQYNSIVDSWDGEDIEKVDEMIHCFKEMEKLYLESEGPPNAEWYKDGLLKEAQKRIEALELMKKGIQNNSDKLIREARKLENEAIAEFAQLTERYEKWLKENSY
jgi:hypothetical protein